MGLSMTEILVIIAVILILFGAKKIPELARSLGRASYEFKKAKEDLVKETRELQDAAVDNAEAADQAKQPEEKKEEK
ncbi:MAG: twin-arginine translocase TatA/TatE family subunit [Lentisphaeria bacterium]|nr:twin-arginine translocase TatA/TatE family subunit [Lentisphaerota bacterium]MBQ6597122.1 twin-arginine translocase TatA/TatE family subunit [Lentisphaeria bacterium]